jgi:hypothetical protein
MIFVITEVPMFENLRRYPRQTVRHYEASRMPMISVIPLFPYFGDFLRADGMMLPRCRLLVATDIDRPLLIAPI